MKEKLRTNERFGCSELGKLKQMDVSVQYLPELQGYIKVYEKFAKISLQIT